MRPERPSPDGPGEPEVREHDHAAIALLGDEMPPTTATEIGTEKFHVKFTGGAAKNLPTILALVALLGVYLIYVRIDKLEIKLDKLTEIMLLRR